MLLLPLAWAQEPAPAPEPVTPIPSGGPTPSPREPSPAVPGSEEAPQEGPAPETDDLPDFAPPPVAAPPPLRPDLPRARTTRWAAVGPLSEDRFVDVAIHPQGTGIWAVAQRDGTVWISVDAGESWIEVLEGAGVRLGSISRDEELILDVQARIEELTDSMGDAGTEEEAADLAGEAAAAAQDVALGIQGEVDQGLWFDDGAGATTVGLGRTRVEFTSEGVLLVSRPDGLRVSPDLGATWIPVLDAPIAHAVETEPGVVLAVGPQGSWTSTDFVQWTDVMMPMPVPPTDLVVDQGIWASTPNGLWVLRGPSWQELPRGTAPLTARPTSDSAYPDLVVGTLQDIFRATPFDSVVDPVLGGPMPSVHDIERAADGSLLAASSVGPYESKDQGRTWQLFSEGLSDPSVEAIEVQGDDVILVGSGGVWRLEPRPEVLPEAPTRPTELPPFAPLGALIESGLTRAELRQRVGSRFVAALVPEVQLEYTQVRDEGPTWYNNDPGGTLYDIDGYWRAQARLTWAPNRQRLGTSFDAEGTDLPVVVVGDEVVVAGEEAPQVLYSKVTRGGAKYRSVLSARITELYRLRARLLLETPPTDIRRAVLRELNLAEVDAKLDALTGGAVSAYLAGVAARPSGASP